MTTSKTLEAVAMAIEPYFSAADKAYGEHRECAQAAIDAFLRSEEMIPVPQISIDDETVVLRWPGVMIVAAQGDHDALWAHDNGEGYGVNSHEFDVRHGIPADCIAAILTPKPSDLTEKDARHHPTKDKP